MAHHQERPITLGRSSASDHTLSNGNHDQDSRDDVVDGGESGKSQGQEIPVNIWDESLRSIRGKIVRQWVQTTLVLCVAILGILSLYWGVLFDVEKNLNSLIVYVVDFETDSSALVGPLVRQMTEEQVKTNMMPHLGYITIPPEHFNNDPINVRQAIYNFDAWAAIVINANATSMLRQAVETGEASYDPLGACQLIFVEARDQTTYSSYITPQLNRLMTEITSKFGVKWAQQVLSNSSIPRTNLGRVPQALNPAIGFSQFNLRPFSPPAATPTVTIGLIYLIIIAFFSFTFYLPIYMQLISKPGPKAKASHVIVFRWMATLLAYLFMSLAYSLISLAFQIHFSDEPAPATEVSQNANGFGRATFVVYWTLNFLGMVALGLACENVGMIIGQPYTALWLVFWVITNVSTSFYSLETAPAFYNWGYAWPLRNIVEGSRTLVFDTYSRLGLNFGVLLAWGAVNTALFPLCCLYLIRKQKREQESKEKDRK